MKASFRNPVLFAAAVTVSLLGACSMDDVLPPAPVAQGEGPPVVTETWDGQEANNARDFAGRLLAPHNEERRRLGLAPLSWSSTLAAHADAYAREMAASGRFAHSAANTREGEGENLFTGTAGAYSLEEMMGGFLDERRMFTRGIFPDVSTTGRWSDVSHYTQIIWPTTTQVGCGLATGHGQDWLVCRYAPAGNVVGKPVG